jgi:hypothetical protein
MAFMTHAYTRRDDIGYQPWQCGLHTLCKPRHGLLQKQFAKTQISRCQRALASSPTHGLKRMQKTP